MGLRCFLFGHDTMGWETVADRFFFRQYAIDETNLQKHGGMIPAHKMCPEWLAFFGYGKYGMKWTHQECKCKRCGTLFWEAEFKPLANLGKG